jgi:hypothetical protein
MSPEVVFLEGGNSSGKDYFIDNAQRYFPQSNVFYAPKDNFKHAPIYDSAYVTFNTIYESIKKDTTNRINFVYRSPLTEMVYNRYYDRPVDTVKAHELFELWDKFSTSFSSSIIYLNPTMETIKERRPKFDENQDEIRRLYSEVLLDYSSGFNLTVETSFDTFLDRILTLVAKLPKEKFILSDVDDTFFTYSKSYRKDFPDGGKELVKVFYPPEAINHPLIFISGRQQSFPCLYSPVFNLFKSSFNFKYAFIKLVIENTEKKFIMYDDYLPLLAKIADDFDLDFSTVYVTPTHIIGRIERNGKCMDNTGLRSSPLLSV